MSQSALLIADWHLSSSSSSSSSSSIRDSMTYADLYMLHQSPARHPGHGQHRKVVAVSKSIVRLGSLLASLIGEVWSVIKYSYLKSNDARKYISQYEADIIKESATASSTVAKRHGEVKGGRWLYDDLRTTGNFCQRKKLLKKSTNLSWVIDDLELSLWHLYWYSTFCTFDQLTDNFLMKRVSVLTQ